MLTSFGGVLASLFLSAVVLLSHFCPGAPSEEDLVCQSVPAVDDVGRLGLYKLKQVWGRFDLIARGCSSSVPEALSLGRDDGGLGLAPMRELKMLLDAIGLGLEPTFDRLSKQSSFDEFEDWVEENAANLNPSTIGRLNSVFDGAEPTDSTRRQLEALDAMDDVLTDQDLKHWEREGYVVVHNAVSPESLAGARQAIWSHIGASPEDEESWYNAIQQGEPLMKGINVQLYKNDWFQVNRESKRIQKAYSQIWNTSDLWMSTDRASFNPPERKPEFHFPGPHMHWDALLMPPLPMSTQGLLYLTDVSAEQGAFSLVPGFHLRIDDWLWEVAARGEHPMDQDLHALGSIPIEGKAGDLVIWDHRLPHGSRPNLAESPRIVQYLNMLPSDICLHQPRPLPEQSCNAFGQCSTGECSSFPAQVISH